MFEVDTSENIFPAISVTFYMLEHYQQLFYQAKKNAFLRFLLLLYFLEKLNFPLKNVERKL